MNRFLFSSSKHNITGVSFLILALVLISGISTAATTISTDISTGGSISVTGTSTFMGNVGIGTTSPASKLSVMDTPSGETTPAAAIIRLFSGTASEPIITMLLRNTGETVGGSDYQNEVHLRLQAGTSADHRRYINFAGPDGVDDWVTGVNAQNSWILYDANSIVHRMSGYTAANGGSTYINAAGAGKIILNQSNSGENAAGNGGLEVWSGGDSASDEVNHILNPQGYQFWKNGAQVFGIDQYGSILGVATAGDLLHLRNGSMSKIVFDNDGRTSFNSGLSSIAQHYFNTSTTTSSSAQYGLHSYLVSTPSADNNTIQAALYGQATASGANQSRPVGVYASAEGSNTDSASYFIGTLSNATYSGASTITSLRSLNTTLNNTNASGVLTSAYGLYVSTPYNNGSIGTIYGIRIDGQNTGTITGSAYGLYQAGTTDKNYFAGSVGIGTASPTSQFQVASTTSNATTSVEFGRTGQNKGSCLVMYDTSGNVQYVSIQNGSLVVSSTSCK